MISVDYICWIILAYVKRGVLCQVVSAHQGLPQITFTTVIVPISGCGCKIAAQKVVLSFL